GVAAPAWGRVDGRDGAVLRALLLDTLGGCADRGADGVSHRHRSDLATYVLHGIGIGKLACGEPLTAPSRVVDPVDAECAPVCTVEVPSDEVETVVHAGGSVRVDVSLRHLTVSCSIGESQRFMVTAGEGNGRQGDDIGDPGPPRLCPWGSDISQAVDAAADAHRKNLDDLGHCTDCGVPRRGMDGGGDLFEPQDHRG